MSAQNPLETWRVETPEGIFETDLETLRQWIREGCVLPGDKVAKGNLHWIEAGRVPLLRAAFGSKLAAPSASLQPAQTVTAATAPVSAVPAAQTFAPASNSWPPPVAPAGSYAASGMHAAAPPPAFAHQSNALGQPACVNHPFTPPQFICRECSATFCQSCPKYVGNKVPLCSVCGDLCKPFADVRKKQMLRQSQTSGFGFNEFGLAIVYPFRHPFSVLLMAVIYAVLSILGLKGQIVACGILFGSMSHVINQFAWGATNCGLYPSFESFSWWDNVIRPMFLSIGIYIVTFGPVIVLSLAILFGVLTLASPETKRQAMQQPNSEMSQRDIDGLLHKADPGYPAPKPVEQTPQPTPGEMKGQKKSDAAGSALLALGLSGTALVLLLLCLGWALFYYPMALTIAGYTEDFWAVVNPKVGLDTMRRMGLTYLKAFFMYLCIQIPALFLMVIMFIILAPFNMPFFGNLPALFMSGIITFIGSLMVACILGFALFKSGDKLDIQVG